VSNAIIKVQGLSKRYVIGHQANGDGLRHAIEGALRDPLKWLKKRSMEKEEFWALNNVSFEVKQGEVVGIIGRNGAGKSTLLKILSRITEPTTGRIEIDGRVASLLEVGTGFHPELTGRENIFLNGAILGMSRIEIKQKFDEIVAFSEVEKFLDTPVKRYSSGMYVRLAFAVAAHLEPEILVVDEVLAVGDAEFQRKCLGKMKDVSQNQGRTVLFVSHNIAAVKMLCSHGMLLQNGKLLYAGPAGEVLQQYVLSGTNESGRWTRNQNKGRESDICFESAFLLDSSGNVKAEFDFEEVIRLRISAFVARDIERAQIAIRVTNQEGVPIFTTCNTDEARQFVPLRAGVANYNVQLTPGLLAPGRYSLKIAAHIPKVQLFDQIDDEISFVIHDTGSQASLLCDDRLGVIYPPVSWKS